MENFVAPNDPIDRERVRELSERSDAKGLARLAIHLTILAATGTGLSLSLGIWWLVPPAMIIHGIVVAFLFTGHHEMIHQTAFKRRWLNDGISFITGFLVFYPALYFRYFHFAHHRFTQDPERDPELTYPPPKTVGAYVWWAIGIPYWHRRFGTSFIHAFTGRAKQPFVRDSDVAACVAEARWMWAGYIAVITASIVFQSWAALIYWVGPILLGQPFLRLYLMAEHTGCASGPDMIANTRTTLTNGMVRLIAWNMPYHTEHHVYPSVPFHALPALHEEMKPYLQVVEPGYLAVHRGLLSRLEREKPETSDALVR
jgi:fatty acid desaturase